MLYFSPELFYIIFLTFAHLWWFGGWGLGISFCGLGFQLMRFGACGVGPSGFFGVGAPYINMEKKP